MATFPVLASIKQCAGVTTRMLHPRIVFFLDAKYFGIALRNFAVAIIDAVKGRLVRILCRSPFIGTITTALHRSLLVRALAFPGLRSIPVGIQPTCDVSAPL